MHDRADHACPAPAARDAAVTDPARAGRGGRPATAPCVATLLLPGLLLAGCAGPESAVDRDRLAAEGRLLERPAEDAAASGAVRTWALAGVLPGDPYVTEPGEARLVHRDGRLRLSVTDGRGLESELVLDTASPWTVVPADATLAETALVDPKAARMPERPDLGPLHEAVAPRLALGGAPGEAVGCTDLPVRIARPGRVVEPVLGAVPAASLRLSRDTRTDRWTLETPSSLAEDDIVFGPDPNAASTHLVPLVDAWLPLVHVHDADGTPHVALIDTGAARSWVPQGSPLAGQELHLRSAEGAVMLRLLPRPSREPVRAPRVGGHEVALVLGLADLGRRSWDLEIARGEWWFIDR